MWSVYQNTDICEGKGSMKLIAIFDNYDDAQSLAMGLDPYGVGVVTKVEQTEIFTGRFEDHPKFNPKWYARNTKKTQKVKEDENKIESLKKMFLELNKMHTKEITLPYEKWKETKDLFSKMCDDGGSWNYQQRYIDPINWYSVYGVRVKYGDV